MVHMQFTIVIMRLQLKGQVALTPDFLLRSESSLIFPCPTNVCYAIENSIMALLIKCGTEIMSSANSLHFK